MTQGREEQELRDTARLMVRAGLAPAEQQEADLAALVARLMPETDPTVLARAWLHAARRQHAQEAAGWSSPTDHDRLRAAMTECARHGVAVLAGVDDMAVVRARVEGAEPPLRGVTWFSERAVWHAIDHGTLEAGLRHGTGHPVQPDDPLAVAVLGCMERHGLRARVRPGVLEVSCWWQRRP